MTQLIPYVGMSGVWGVDPLLAQYVRPDTVYTCQAVRSLIEMIELQADPLNSIYRALNLPQSQYESDLQNAVLIVSLVDSLGNWRYVPTSLITALPNVNGVLYQSYTIELNVDPLPSYISLEPISEELRELAQARLGVDVTVSYRANAASILIDEATAKAKETLRLTQINEDFSANAQVRILQERVRVLQNLVNKMLGCFKSNCQSGRGLVIPIILERTPGQNGYIDASDLVLDRPIVANNAIDLILYGHNGKVSTRSVISTGVYLDSAGIRGEVTAGDYIGLDYQVAMSAPDLHLHSVTLDPDMRQVSYTVPEPITLGNVGRVSAELIVGRIDPASLNAYDLFYETMTRVEREYLRVYYLADSSSGDTTNPINPPADTSDLIEGQSDAADYLLDAPRALTDAPSLFLYGLYQDERNPLLTITLLDYSASSETVSYISDAVDETSQAVGYLLDAPRTLTDAVSFFIYGLYQDERNPLLHTTLSDR